MVLYRLHNRRPANCHAAIFGLLCAFVLAVPSVSSAQAMKAPFDPLSFSGPDPAERFQDIKIEQRLEAQVPLDLTFTDERGHQVQLGDYLGDRPAILVLVYYECPMLCNLVLDGVEAVLGAVKYDIGTDYDVITVSIDPKETPELAARKKANHLERLNRDGAEEGWHFLTGDEVGIDILADTVGFRYVYDPATGQFAHAAGIMILTPLGQIARYYYGIDYIPRDVEFGLVEASQGRIGTIVDQLILLCFAYDPSTGKYGLLIFRTIQFAATLMLLGFAIMYTFLFLRMRKKKAAALLEEASSVHTTPGAAD